MRWAWNLSGFASLGAGIVGIYVPGMPTTVFLILALFFFAKGGNHKTRAWLLGHPRFGKVLTDWEETKSISLRVKWIAIGCITVSCGVSAQVLPSVWAKWAVLVAGAAGVWYIATRKTKAETPSKANAAA